MEKRIFVCIVILNFVTAALAQNANAILIADSLTSVSLYDNNGWGGTPKAWTLQERLNGVATNDDLVALAHNHHNGAARAVAFRLLVARGDNRYRDILYTSLRDTTSFIEQAFDVIYISNVANYMVNALTNSQKDSVTLDSVLFFTPNLQHIDRLRSILKNLPVEERYYKRLHQLYYEEGCAEALPSLCHYRREADKVAVIECLLEYSKGLDKEDVIEGPEGRTNQGLEAVAIWPDPAFLPALRKVRNYEVKRKHYDYWRIRLFYLALMAYDDENSYNFIDETLRMTNRDKTTRHYHLEYFRKAYDMYPRSRYESLIKKYDEQ